MPRTDPRIHAEVDTHHDPHAWARLAAALDGGHTLPCRPNDDAGTEWTSSDPREQRRAADLCSSCGVLQACRTYALASRIPDGVWGGLTPAARKRHRREHRATTKAAA